MTEATSIHGTEKYSQTGIRQDQILSEYEGRNQVKLTKSGTITDSELHLSYLDICYIRQIQQTNNYSFKKKALLYYRYLMHPIF